MSSQQVRTFVRSISPPRNSRYKSPLKRNNSLSRRSLSPVRENCEINSQNNSRSQSPIQKNITQQSSFKITSSYSSCSLSSLASGESFTFSPSTSSICLSQLEINRPIPIFNSTDILNNVILKFKRNEVETFDKKCEICGCIFKTSKKLDKYCSYRCHKISHYNKELKCFNIKCKKCNKIFNTKNIFTDYCSDECYKLI